MAPAAQAVHSTSLRRLFSSPVERYQKELHLYPVKDHYKFSAVDSTLAASIHGWPTSSKKRNILRQRLHQFIGFKPIGVPLRYFPGTIAPAKRTIPSNWTTGRLPNLHDNGDVVVVYTTLFRTAM